MKEKIMLAHGGGGRLMHKLISELFVDKFDNEILGELSDSAVIKSLNSRENDSPVLFTTDSYVVNPLFFPGADIGKLAICGTINDLAVMGAVPLYISSGFIIEEGLEYEVLKRITESMANTAREEKVKIVTGDVKVVEKNSADKLFINTSGIGIGEKGISLSKKKIEPGDKIIVSGSIGEHGLAILAARGDFDFKTEIKSDCAPLTDLIQKIINPRQSLPARKAGLPAGRGLSSQSAVTHGIKFMRDPTRGGLATTLNEIVDGMDFGIKIDEEYIPIKEQVKALCEILGLDPLYVANEGKVVVIVSRGDAQAILGLMRQHPLGRESQIIGEIIKEPNQKVIMKTEVGGSRIIDMLTGDQLPRIC